MLREARELISGLSDLDCHGETRLQCENTFMKFNIQGGEQSEYAREWSKQAKQRAAERLSGVSGASEGTWRGTK